MGVDILVSIIAADILTGLLEAYMAATSLAFSEEEALVTPIAPSLASKEILYTVINLLHFWQSDTIMAGGNVYLRSLLTIHFHKAKLI